MTNQHAKFLGKLGGKQSVRVRFKGLSKSEISEKMRKVRVTKEQQKNIDTIQKEIIGEI